jgi:hypothetical protein
VRPSARSRAGAAGTLVVGLVLLGQLPAVWAAAPYLGVLDAAAAVAAGVVGLRLGHRRTPESLAVAVVVVALALAGQLVAAVAGLPGASTLEGLGPWSAGVAVLQAVTLVLLVRDVSRFIP